jgi:hypothetical protein
LRLSESRRKVLRQQPLEGDAEPVNAFKLRARKREEEHIAAARPDKVEELTADWQRWNRSLQKPRWPSR